jgi:hypothetical protein
MTDRKTVLVHIHVSQGDGATRAGAGSVKAVVSSPGGSRATIHTAPGSARGERCWAVAFHGQKYTVVDAGTSDLKMTLDEAVVWTGQRLSTGDYKTLSTTLPTAKLEGLLKLVRVGDSRTPKVHVAEPAHRAPASATVSARQAARAAPAETKPTARRGRKPKAKPAAAAHTSTSKPAPKSSARRASKSPTAKSTQTASAPPAASAKRRRGRPPKQAAPATAAAPASKKVDRAPATRRSLRNPAVDDIAVLAEIKKKVRREDPKNAPQLYDALQRIWFAGGREATLAWMATKNMATVVEAFSDWVDKNGDAARALLEKAASSGRGAAA